MFLTVAITDASQVEHDISNPCHAIMGLDCVVHDFRLIYATWYHKMGKILNPHFRSCAVLCPSVFIKVWSVENTF